METKHTPGPWSVTMKSTCSAAWPAVVTNDDATDEQVDVAELGTSHIFNYAKFDASNVAAAFDERPELFTEHSEHDLQMANARLIAAAPELLEALKKFTTVMDGCSNWPDTTSTQVKLGDIANEASSAIAKATGSAA